MRLSEVTLSDIFKELFPVPYEHEKWLKDQAILIERMRATNIEFFTEQADKLQVFQDAGQASIVMVDILVDRVKKYLTTDETSVIINNDDVIVDARQ